jgi:hypothetical protein
MSVCLPVTAITHGNIRRYILKFDSSCEVIMRYVVQKISNSVHGVVVDPQGLCPIEGWVKF